MASRHELDQLQCSGEIIKYFKQTLERRLLIGSKVESCKELWRDRGNGSFPDLNTLKAQTIEVLGCAQCNADQAEPCLLVCIARDRIWTKDTAAISRYELCILLSFQCTAH